MGGWRCTCGEWVYPHQVHTCPPRPVIYSGYTCAFCNAWVSNGTPHSCMRSASGTATTPPFLPRLSNSDVERIAERVVGLIDERDRKRKAIRKEGKRDR